MRIGMDDMVRTCDLKNPGSLKGRKVYENGKSIFYLLTKV